MQQIKILKAPPLNEDEYTRESADSLKPVVSGISSPYVNGFVKDATLLVTFPRIEREAFELISS